MKQSDKYRKRLHTKNSKRVTSEAIISIDYDELHKIFEIEFTGGKIYQYTKINKRIWNEMVTIIKNKESIGTYINQEFKKMIEDEGCDYYEL